MVAGHAHAGGLYLAAQRKHCNIGYDWFAQWGTNEALGADYAVGALTWNSVLFT